MEKDELLMVCWGALTKTGSHALPGVFDGLALLLSFSICEPWLIGKAVQRVFRPALGNM